MLEYWHPAMKYLLILFSIFCLSACTQPYGYYNSYPIYYPIYRYNRTYYGGYGYSTMPYFGHHFRY